MTITKIKDVYKKDISQKVKGVIMAEQGDDETVYSELSEFVITKELHRHINNFFERYNDVNDNKKDTIGVWISGFFGSGKSHLLKILSYLLENKKVKDKTPLEFFSEKLSDDQLLLGNITRAIGKKDIDIMLFNIDSRAGKNAKNHKDGILEVFVKVFNEKLGYCSDIPWLADFEHALFMKGKYESFKSKFKEISNESWDAIKDNFYFERDNIIKTLMKSDIMSENEANHWFSSDSSNYTMPVSRFADIIKKYCEKKGNEHRIVFLVDEIGQYIGDDTSLMLNLQTLVEDLGKELNGQAWIIVTSQEAINSITEIKGKDFSKIQGRFPTKLMLSAENTDEVVKKRLLEKTDEAKEYLEAYYLKNETIIKNLFSFSSGTAEMKKFKNKEDFASTYPFIPYQFNLLQKVFEKIRVIGISGSHIADGNRSMLNGYQEAGCAILDKNIGTIAPFSSFYNTIETFISSEIKRTISQAKDNSILENLDIEVLKILFMIRYVEHIPCDLENVTTLLISNIDEDKQELRNNIKLSLTRLMSQTLIHKNGDEYLFLTNDEQNINKEINAEDVDKSELLKHIGDVVFNEFYKPKKYTYSPHNIYFYNQLVDDYQYEYARQHGLVIKISTSYCDQGDNALFYAKDYALGEIKLENDTELMINLRNLKKIEKWIKKNNSSDVAKNIKEIISDKAKEIDEIKIRVRKLLEDSIKKGIIYINGKKIDHSVGGGVANMINDMLNKLVISVYKNVDWITRHYDSDSIIKILKLNNIEEQALVKTEDNINAIEEIKIYIQMQSDRSIKTSLKTIIDKYTAIPYGWNEFDIAGIIAHLFISGDIQLKYNEEVLHKGNSYIIDYLTKNREFEKLIIATKKHTDKGILLKVKAIIQENFDKTDLPDNEEDLFKKIKSIFNEENDKLDSFNSKYLISNYPVKNIFNNSKDIVNKFIKIPDNITFFNYIISQKEEIESHEQNMRTILSFFDSQVNIYEDAKSKISFYEDELKLFSMDERLNIDLDKIEDIKKILSSSSPYSQIKDLSSLLVDIKVGYTKILKNKRKDLSEKLNNIIQVIKQEIDKNSFSKDFINNILSSFDEIKNTINNTQSCKELSALTSSLVQKNTFVNQLITNEINRIIESNSDKSKDKPKRQVSIEINNLIKKGITIKSSDDVDKYTDDLNKTLKEKLDAGDNIRII